MRLRQCRVPRQGQAPDQFACSAWRSRRSRDPAVVASWLSKVPLANWGLAMGMNGLIAVTSTHATGGDATWEALIIKYGEPPETWTARTGGGGTHLILHCPTA